jgi:hypothetical protein
MRIISICSLSWMGRKLKKSAHGTQKPLAFAAEFTENSNANENDSHFVA